MADIFGGGFNPNAYFEGESYPTAKNESTTPDGWYTVVAIAKPEATEDGVVILKDVINADSSINAEARKVPSMRVHLFLLGEGRVEVTPVLDTAGVYTDFKFEFPATLRGVKKIEFMNDESIKVQFKKNSLAKELDCYFDKKETMDYNKLQGKIFSGWFKTRTWKGKDDKEKSNQGLNYWDKETKKVGIVQTVYIAKKAITHEGKIVEGSYPIKSLPAIIVDKMYNSYDEILAKQQAASATSPEVKPDVNFVPGDASENFG